MKLKIAVVVIAVLYISIFLHEMGHVLAFRHNGIAVEKVSVGTIWKLRMTVFTDASGTKYEIGPVLLWGYTQSVDPGETTGFNLAREAEIWLAGIAINAFIVLFLTPWYFLFKGEYQKAGVDFTSFFGCKVFRAFIVVNVLLFISNALWLVRFVDGGAFLYSVLSQWLEGMPLTILFFLLGLISFLYLWNELVHIMGKINKIYGWSGWPGPKERR